MPPQAKPKALRLRGGRRLEFGPVPLLMGVMNLTPDSFSDGGSNSTLELAVERALKLLDDGAAIIDVGGESTRPGSSEVPLAEEIVRIVPLIMELRHLRPDCVISVDTRKSEVASAALAVGADILNDVSGFQFSPEMPKLALASGAAICAMHMRGTPATMQNPEMLRYEDLIAEVSAFLLAAVAKAEDAGVSRESIILDPGLGFSKDFDQNMLLMREMERFHSLGCPLLVGPSRKSFIGAILEERDPLERDFGTCGAALALAVKGVQILRVHNVKAVKQALDVFAASGGLP